MEDRKKKGILGGTGEKVFDILGEILGFFTILLIVFLFANVQWNFLQSEELVNTLYAIQTYAIIATVGVVGLEFAAKRGWIFFIIFAALVAVTVIFTFLPEVSQSIMSRL